VLHGCAHIQSLGAGFVMHSAGVWIQIAVEARWLSSHKATHHMVAGTMHVWEQQLSGTSNSRVQCKQLALDHELGLA
jgi:hypothetical protein